METNIVGVKFEDNIYRKTFAGREYSYYTTLPLNIGDLVEAPTKYGTNVALVTSINVPEEKIANIKDLVKTINVKLDKKSFINSNILEPAV